MPSTAKNDVHILVIDDEPGIRSLLEYELGLEGYRVVTCPNGAQGIACAKRERFQVVVTDIKMPGMDGVHVLEEIKRIDPDTEVIVVTGYGTIGTAVDAIRKGAYDFIQKPFNIEEMLALIQRALEKTELKTLISLYEMSKAVFSVMRLEDLLPVLADLSLAALKADSVSLYLYDAHDRLSLAAHRGHGSVKDKKVCLDMANVAESLFSSEEEGALLRGPAAELPSLTRLAEEGSIGSFLIAPLFSRRKLNGILLVSRSSRETLFTGTDERTLNILMSQIAQAIDNARLYLELENKVEDLAAANNAIKQASQGLERYDELSALSVLVQEETARLETAGNDLEKAITTDAPSLSGTLSQCTVLLTRFRRLLEENDRDEIVTVNDILGSSLKMLAPSFSARDIAVSFTPSLTIPELRADSVRLMQAFIAVLLNARARLAGAAKASLSVVISMTEDRGRAKIVVRDNAPEITEETEAKIFLPFYIADVPVSGAALVPGLSFAARIIRQYAGEITLSKEKNGNVIAITFPV